MSRYSHLPTILILLLSNWPKYTRQTYMLHTSNLSTFPNVLCIFCSPFIFDGNLANLSSFPRYNSFSMWPLKLFENSIQLHRIENWLKSWRPGESGRDSYIYDCPPPPLSNRQTRRIAKHEFWILQSSQCQFLALSEEYSLFTPVLDICSDLPSPTYPNTT